MDTSYFEVQVGYTLSRKEIEELVGGRESFNDDDLFHLATQIPYMGLPYDSITIHSCSEDQVCLAILEIVIRLTPNSFEIGV